MMTTRGYDCRESNGCPFMVASDAMVSDHSWIAFEYMLLNRPLIVIDRPALIHKAAIGRREGRASCAAADVDPRRVATTVLAALQQPQRLSAERRRAPRTLFFDPGNATDRALALIYQLIESFRCPLRRSPRPIEPAGCTR